MTLTEIQPGHQAEILSIDKMNPLIRRRLIDLGIMEGSIVRLKNKLPFDGPLMIESNGQIIGIRHKEARTIEVLPK